MKRITSIILALLTLVGTLPLGAIYVSAEDAMRYDSIDVAGSTTDYNEIINPGAPYNFNKSNLQDPYGYGKGVPFLLSEQNELFYMHNYKGSSTVKIKDTLKSKSSNTGRVLDSFRSSSDGAVNDEVKYLNFTKAVACDPTGSGRKDHVAVVGVNSSKDLVIYFYNTKDKKWSSSLTLGSMNWVSNSSYYYWMTEFISITAGDYNGDKKDTVVVYGSFNGDGGQGIYEVKMNSMNDLQKINGSSDQSMLNPCYTGYLWDDDFFDSDEDDGESRLVCVLATGDINGDGIDDLAAVSHSFTENDDYYVDYIIPYLMVITGKSGVSGILQGNKKFGGYVGNGVKDKDDDTKTYTTLRAESMTFINTDANRGDEIIIAGEEVTYEYDSDDGEYSDAEQKTNLATVKYTWSNGNVSRVYYANQCYVDDSTETMSENGFTRKGIEDVDNATSQVAVQGVYMNGKGNYAYVMVGGDIYDYSGAVLPKKIYDFSFLNDSDNGIGGSIISINFISSAAAGNFDGNSEGYQQIIMALGRKQESYDDTFFSTAIIGIDHTKRDPATGIPTDLSTAFYVTDTSNCEKMDADDEGDDFDEALAFLLVAVDSDNDGVLAKYNSKNYAYSDPDVLAILQEAPYFSELDPYIADHGYTSYTISETKTLTQGSSNSISFGIGGKFEVEGAVADVSISAGYSLEWSESFEESISYTIEESWQAQTDDSVILYRTPWFFFNYDIYDAKTGKWEENCFTIATENEPFYSQLSVEEYNGFVDYYNNDLLKGTSSKPLTKINTRASHLELHGNPYAYPDSAAKTYGSLQQMAYNGSATSISNSNESEMAHTTETSHGFTFEYSRMYGFELLGNGTKAGIETSLESISGTSTGESTGKGITCSGTVQGVVEADMKRDGYTAEQIRAYTFSWKLGIWDSNVPTGKTDENGNTLYIPVVGYVVSNVASLPHPITEMSAEVSYDSVGNPQGIEITWSDPSEEYSGYPKPTGYNIYLIYDGEYELIEQLPYGKTEFFFSDLQARSSLRFEVRSVRGTVESLEGKQSACYISYIGATGERGEKGPKGDKGDKGATGVGISDIRMTSRSGNVDTYTVTLTDGKTFTFTVTNADSSVAFSNDIEEGDYIIFSAVNDAMSLAVSGGFSGKNAGDNVLLWTNGDANVFTITKDRSTGTYKIKSKSSGFVLDVEGSSKSNGANILQYYDTGTSNQRWFFEPAENGYYYIRCMGGQYMDVSGVTGSVQPYDGVNIQSWSFTGANNQRFRLFKVSSINTGSALSGGDLWIIIIVAICAVGGIAALVIVKKKKKPEQKSEDLE